jgi:hypothetical protein
LWMVVRAVMKTSGVKSKKSGAALGPGKTSDHGANGTKNSILNLDADKPARTS